MRRSTAFGTGLLAALVALPAPAQRKADAPFDAPIVIAPAVSSITDVLDLDADGWLDAVGFLRDRVDGWTNDGTGELVHAFELTPELPNRQRIRQLRTGRLDGDDRDDFAVGYLNFIEGFSSNGSAAPTRLFRHGGVPDVRDFELADFDGDGIDDVVALLRTSGGITLKLYRNGGMGSLVLLDEATFTSRTDPEGLFVAELNGDGRPDFGFARENEILLFPLVGPFLPPPLVVPRLVAEPQAVGGDIDGDGDEDVVIFGWAAGRRGYQVLRRTGSDSFEPETAGVGGYATALVDVDGDGDLDGVGADGADWSRPNLAASVFHVAMNDGSGAFGASALLPGLGATRLAGAADLDRDGDVDLVAGRCAYYASGPLREFGRPALPIPGPPPANPRALVDADADGDLDVHFSLAQTADNRGDGTFASRVPAVFGAPPGRTLVGPGIAGDFDGDGAVDLLVEARDRAQVFIDLRLFRNLGCGAFVDGGVAAPPRANPCPAANLAREPSLVVTLDLDRDGDVDLLAQEGVTLPFRTRSWLNDGSGFFVPAQDLPSEHMKGAADLDGDSIADVIVRMAHPEALGIRLGLGDGTFGPIQPLSGLRSVFACTLADFDRDGDVDIAGVSTDAPGAFVIARNDGSAFFTPSFPIGVGITAPSSPTPETLVIPTDFDGDGRLDLLVRVPTTLAEHPLTALFAADEDGLNYSLASLQVFWAARAADLDGDGDEDLIQAPFAPGFGSDPSVRNSDRVIRNRRTASPAASVRRQYGVGAPGTGGLVPVLGVAGPNLVPGVRPEYRLSGGRGGARAFLLIGTATASEPTRGGTLLVESRWRRELRLGGDTGEAGTGGFRFLARPVAPRQAGRTFHFQALVRDPAASEGFAFSNGLSITFGSGD